MYAGPALLGEYSNGRGGGGGKARGSSEERNTGILTQKAGKQAAKSKYSQLHRICVSWLCFFFFSCPIFVFLPVPVYYLTFLSLFSPLCIRLSKETKQKSHRILLHTIQLGPSSSCFFFLFPSLFFISILYVYCLYPSLFSGSVLFFSLFF